MIRDILDFARGRLGGGIPVNRHAADLSELCREIIDEVQAAYPAARIDLGIEGDLCGAWDWARIEQALSNLVVNAIQHGAGDVNLSLSGRAHDYVVVVVRNAGSPISAEQLPNLFDAFHKGDRSPAGLGLGLFIVREIVRAHDGTIEVASSSDGTTFTMRLATLVGRLASDADLDLPVDETPFLRLANGRGARRTRRRRSRRARTR